MNSWNFSRFDESLIGISLDNYINVLNFAFIDIFAEVALGLAGYAKIIYSDFGNSIRG